ncbi:hypothetical protein HZS61_006476 [Fusarium oxysporum f. sp. conglutinans]|uniref:DUF7082 domain-containing protein n=1 Tax=Fusarium oxysporum f. sp. conglutinans TaxID=100902 RepID=A0A8H6LCM3_FUSOX|nr:hypothetical protein HZS61_006476 [Fusarium oxysporum f. sp. conglutinans]
MTSTDQDLPNGLSTHTFTEVDIASQLMSHYITQGYDDQEWAPVSVPCDYEDTSAPDQYTEQPTPHLSHNICNDVSQGETGSPTSNDMDKYPFKCGQLGCGHAFSDEAHQHQHQNKCKLVLEVLDWRKSMTENWTTEEQANSRRIVLFHRIQMYSQVKAICQPVSIKERIINYICISCIWWAEKGECYVTSVDIIRLLEQLIVPSNCFSVKEKNLIHCELEKLHPQIVHKTKPDTQEFFKIIMGFSDPKALSTGEDVKVFPWENLDSALENIIRSYMVLSRLTATAPNAGSGQRELATPEIETLTDDYPNTLLSLDKQTDGVYDTYQNTEEQARGSKLSAKIDDWGHPIADGTVTIYNKNTLLTNFDRGTQYDIPVRDLCPEVQNKNQGNNSAQHIVQ